VAAVASGLRRNADLIVTSGSTFATGSSSNAEYGKWFERAAETRYPGLQALGYVERVPADRLAAFAAARKTDPTPNSPPGPFVVVPAGPRPEYCLTRLEATGAAAPAQESPIGLDFCAFPDTSANLRESAATGRFRLLALGESELAARGIAVATTSHAAQAAAAETRLSGFSILMALPVYSGTPTNPAEREAQLLGWVGGAFDGPSIVRSIMTGHEDLALTLSWTDAGENVVVAKQNRAFHGAALHHATAFDADGQWTMEVATAGRSGRSRRRWPGSCGHGYRTGHHRPARRAALAIDRRAQPGSALGRRQD